MMRSPEIWVELDEPEPPLPEWLQREPDPPAARLPLALFLAATAWFAAIGFVVSLRWLTLALAALARSWNL